MAATDRLFLASFPDSDTAAGIAALAAEQCAAHGLRGRPLLPGRFHVTLFHLGDTVGLRQDVVDAATVAASRLKARGYATGAFVGGDWYQGVRVGDRLEHFVHRLGDPRRNPEFQIHNHSPLESRRNML